MRSISIACALAGGDAQAAFQDSFSRGPFTVVEYYNLHLDHYFLTMDPSEMAGIEAGRAGPGWVRTGHGFEAYARPGTRSDFPCFEVDCGVPVSRFYGPSPNSHFYSGFASEVAFHVGANTGWLLERVEFHLPLPGAQGQCPHGLQPVHRLYNNRWMFNDSNHRFVADTQARAKMIARGWIDEGVAFCSPRALDVPLKSFVLDSGEDWRIRPSAQCEDESLNIGPCIALNNLPVPATRWSSYPFPPPPAVSPGLPGPEEFSARTGVHLGERNLFLRADSPTPADDVFVQALDTSLGVHVDTRSRGTNALSSVNPLYQLRTSVDASGRDERFFPFAVQGEDELQLAVSFDLRLKGLEVRSPGGAAFGHPTLEFIDRRSGRHLYFTALVYGSVGPYDYLAPDPGTGKVIVGTTLREATPYLRNAGRPTLHTASSFASGEPQGTGGRFEFGIDRVEFQRVLDAARTVDPALSADPRDYLLDNFHFNNEVFGDGRIGLNIRDFKAELRRR